jgi:hypothetical protein
MAISKELLAESVRIRNLLNSDSRHFKWNDDAKETWEKKYRRLEHDIKLLRFAEDSMGAISDCYLLYAVACLGCTDTDGIRMFLRAMRDNCAGVSIMDIDNLDYVRNRLKSLVSLGFLFVLNYTVYAHDTKGKLNENGIKLFTIEKGGQSFMNQKLAKRTEIHEWMQAKPEYELIGWAAASYVQGFLSNSGRYIEAKQGVFQTKAIGRVFIPGIVKMKLSDDRPVDVGIISAYLHKGQGFMTDTDYESRCKFTVNLIKQYLFNRDSKKHIARVVVVVEDNADLVEVASWIENMDILSDDYDRIYFTGEGAIRYQSDIKNVFLQMVKGATKQPFIPVQPDFL